MSKSNCWILLAALSLLFGLLSAGCNNKDGEAPPPEKATAAPATTSKAPPPTSEDEAAERRIQNGKSTK